MTRRSLFLGLFLVPALAFAAGDDGGHAGPDVGGLVRHGVNFLLLAGVLYWALRGPLSDFLNFRRAEVKDQLDTALEAKTTAEERYAALQARLDDFDAELAELHEQVKTDAAAEHALAIANAERSAKQLEEAAQRTLDEELRRARAELRAEAVDLSVKIAEELLTSNITDADQARLTGDYLSRVEETAHR